MMGYYGSSMMGNWGMMGALGLIIWLELPIIGALVIAWLWKQLKR